MIAIAVTILGLIAVFSAPLLAAKVALAVVGIYALYRAVLEGLKRLSQLDDKAQP